MAKTGATDEGRLYTEEEVRVMIVEAASDGASPIPATEEGPHLKDRDIAAAKATQLAEYDGDVEMTSDMQRITKGR